MRTVLNLLEAAEKMDINLLMQEAMASGKDVYVSQQKEQLWQGIGSDKRAIMPFYSPKTIVIKQQKGQPFNRVTLKDTGDFYNSIFVDPRGESMYVDSRDSKVDDLEKKYGETILGLGGSFRVPYVAVVQTNMLTSVKTLLRL